MSSQYLNTLSENATRFGMRLQETISEHTRELGLSRATSSATYLETSTDEKTIATIRKQLDGNSDREKLDAMKRLIAVSSEPFHYQQRSENQFKFSSSQKAATCHLTSLK